MFKEDGSDEVQRQQMDNSYKWKSKHSLTGVTKEQAIKAENTENAEEAVNSQDQFGWTALHRATHRGQYSKCADLIAKGADVNIPDEHGFTPLFIAANWGFYNIAKLFCIHGANIKYKNYVGKNAINVAEDKNFHHIVSLLREYI